jgi:hypothetical protein
MKAIHVRKIMIPINPMINYHHPDSSNHSTDANCARALEYRASGGVNQFLRFDGSTQSLRLPDATESTLSYR